jgi:hypothetical protein
MFCSAPGLLPDAERHAPALAALPGGGAVAMLILDEDILGGKFVAPRAVRPRDRGLSRAHRFQVLRRSDGHEAAQDIGAGIDRFEVIGVDAASDATEVVNLQPVGDRPLGVFIRQPMGGNAYAAPACRHTPVTAALPDSAVPNPAAAEWNGDAAAAT